MATRIYLGSDLKETAPIPSPAGWEDVSQMKAWVVPAENIETVECVEGLNDDSAD